MFYPSVQNFPSIPFRVHRAQPSHIKSNVYVIIKKQVEGSENFQMMLKILTFVQLFLLIFYIHLNEAYLKGNNIIMNPFTSFVIIIIIILLDHRTVELIL
jgi:hypothetical protein